jgi:hypothetical protein
MIGLLLPLLLQAGTPAGVEDRVMLCQLRTATLSDPSAPTRLVPEGNHRLLAFRLKGPVTGRIQGSAVEMHDPTTIMLGRSVEYVEQRDGTTGFVMSGGSKTDMLALAASAAPPGRAGGEAYLTRLKRGRTLAFAVGVCGFLPAADGGDAFEKVKTLPGTQP